MHTFHPFKATRNHVTLSLTQPRMSYGSGLPPAPRFYGSALTSLGLRRDGPGRMAASGGGLRFLVVFVHKSSHRPGRRVAGGGSDPTGGVGSTHTVRSRDPGPGGQRVGPVKRERSPRRDSVLDAVELAARWLTLAPPLASPLLASPLLASLC